MTCHFTWEPLVLNLLNHHHIQVRCVWVNSACASRFVIEGNAARAAAADPLASGGRVVGTSEPGSAAAAAASTIKATAATSVASMLNRSAASRRAMCGLLKRVAGRNGIPVKTWDM